LGAGGGGGFGFGGGGSGLGAVVGGGSGTIVVVRTESTPRIPASAPAAAKPATATTDAARSTAGRRIRRFISMLPLLRPQYTYGAYVNALVPSSAPYCGLLRVPCAGHTNQRYVPAFIR
jgi:hypothetical protein